MGSRTELGALAGHDGPTSPGTAEHPVRPLTIFQRLGAEGARMLVQVVGEIDLVTVPVLADALELGRLAAGRMPALVEIEVDLRAVTFLSAAGLTGLVDAHRRCAQDEVRLRVVAGHRAVTWPLRLTGLDRLLGLRADPDRHPPTGVVPGRSPGE